MTARKFRIHRKSREQGNFTGRPWLIDLPVGQRWLSGGGMTVTTGGVCTHTFEEARSFVADRIDQMQATS